jgi:thioredoxin reductase (NADPH)
MAEEQVCAVDGANSAGQAALHLTKFAARVTLLARGEPLAASMSDYFITLRKTTPTSKSGSAPESPDGHGQARLKALTLQDIRTGPREQVPAAAVFVMTGAEPHTHTMAPRPHQAERSWIHPGRPRRSPGRMAAAPSTPAVRDEPAGRIRVRYGSVNRVAGAVGEGRPGQVPVSGIYAGLPVAWRLASDETRLPR